MQNRFEDQLERLSQALLIAESPLTVRVHYQQIEDRQAAVGIEIWTSDPALSHEGEWFSQFSEDPDAQTRPLRTQDLIAVSRFFRTLVREELRPQAEAFVPNTGEKQKGSRRRLAYSDEELARALRIFDTARRYQQPGTRAVAQTFGITPKAAERLVARARQKGSNEGRDADNAATKTAKASSKAKSSRRKTPDSARKRN